MYVQQRYLYGLSQLRTKNIYWSQVRLMPFCKVPALSIRFCSMDKRMLSLLLLTCRRGITWMSLRVCLGWLKYMGTDSSMSISMPHLCSLKHSLNVSGLVSVLTREFGVLFNATFAVE